MKLVHKHNAQWYAIKSLVILVVLGVTVLHIQFKANTRELSQSQSSSSSGVATTLQASSFSTSILASLLNKEVTTVASQSSSSLNNYTSNYFVSSSSNQEEPLGDDGDDDGNTKICHKVARYRNNKCQYVKDNCKSPLAGGLINYLRIRYCGFERVPFFFFVFAVCIHLSILFN
jgi:hypothetical protein